MRTCADRPRRGRARRSRSAAFGSARFTGLNAVRTGGIFGASTVPRVHEILDIQRGVSIRGPERASADRRVGSNIGGVLLGLGHRQEPPHVSGREFEKRRDPVHVLTLCQQSAEYRTHLRLDRGQCRRRFGVLAQREEAIRRNLHDPLSSEELAQRKHAILGTRPLRGAVTVECHLPRSRSLTGPLITTRLPAHAALPRYSVSQPAPADSSSSRPGG
jgi:hypothetical protein